MLDGRGGSFCLRSSVLLCEDEEGCQRSNFVGLLKVFLYVMRNGKWERREPFV